MQRNVPSAQDMLREFASLNLRRRGSGVTPLEYQRWLDLGKRLEAAFPNQPSLAKKGKVRLLVELKDESELLASVMMNVRPMGLFVNTPFPPDRGTKLDLKLKLIDTDAVYSSQVVVVSNNGGPEFSTEAFGMGLKFSESSCELRSVLDELCGFPPSDESSDPAAQADPES